MTTATEPRMWLPHTPEQWRRRTVGLIAALRRPGLAPSRGHLYQRNANGTLSACIEGVVNDLAIRAGVPAYWIEMEVDGPDERPVTVWEAMPLQDDTSETTNRVLPEALFYHGLDMPDGAFYIDVLDCDREFIRRVLNGRHGISFEVEPAAGLNDSLIRQGANPLLVAADLLDHLMTRPLSSVWHPTVNYWAQGSRI